MLGPSTIGHWLHTMTPAARQRVMCEVFIQRYRDDCALGMELNSDAEYASFVTRIRQKIAEDLKNKLVGQLCVPLQQRIR